MAEELLEADLKDTAQFHEGFSGGFPEGADLEKDQGALVSVSRMPSAFQWLMYRHRECSGISVPSRMSLKLMILHDLTE